MNAYHVFDTFQDAVLVIDVEGKVFYGNGAAAFLLEVSARRLSSGRSLGQFVTFAPDPFKAFGSIASVLEATQVKEVEFTTSSGKTGWAQISLQPQPEGFTDVSEERARWIVCLRDVSLEKTLHDKYRAELDQKEEVIRDLRVARAKLEDYSRNLEKMVEARTAELRETNRLLKTILDSLGQGILVFGADGGCLPVFSQVCRRILGTEPSGRLIEDVLQLQGESREAFANWRLAVFAEMMDFDDLVPLAPSEFLHTEDKSISLSYNPMRDGDGDGNGNGKMAGVVLVATDRTREVEALREAARERELVRRVVQVARNRESFRRFIGDARSLLRELRMASGSGFKLELEHELERELELQELARRLHTLKGGSSSFGLVDVARAAHRLEDLLGNLLGETGSDAEAVVRFKRRLAEEAGQIDGLLTAELASLSELLGNLGEGETSAVEVSVDCVREWSRRLSKAGSADEARAIGHDILREALEKPLASFVAHLEPSLKELAAGLGKRLSRLVIEGGELRVPDEPLRGLLTSLVHAFRNSIDHGLETPEERLRAGKSEEGTIRVRFAVETIRTDRPEMARELRIEISDDGRGVDPEKIRAKLRAQGREDLAAASDAEVIQAILRDDFSTAENVSEISGRGVGLSAIAAEAVRLGGTISVFPGATVDVGAAELNGMSLVIRVPVPGLVLELSGDCEGAAKAA